MVVMVMVAMAVLVDVVEVRCVRWDGVVPAVAIAKANGDRRHAYRRAWERRAGVTLGRDGAGPGADGSFARAFVRSLVRSLGHHLTRRPAGARALEQLRALVGLGAALRLEQNLRVEVAV